ncbi:MAG: hypothetical protein JWL88_454 [Parcubacteria group bacterium]|nr:hypothetical protein [Parcubacteria group bacterium]
MDDFDLWNMSKKRLESQDMPIRNFPKVGEVWVVIFGKNIGREQNGGKNFTRPGLVVKNFNNELFWVVPLTTKQKDTDFNLNYADPGGNAVSAIISQMKPLSNKRFRRKMYLLESKTRLEIKEKIMSFF